MTTPPPGQALTAETDARACYDEHQPGCDCAVPEETVARSKPPHLDRLASQSTSPTRGEGGWSEYEDDLSDAIGDSIDINWTSRDGAKAVVRWLQSRRPLSSQAIGIRLTGQQGDPAGLMTVAVEYSDGREEVVIQDNGNVISHWARLPFEEARVLRASTSALAKATAGIDDDYMTSETHHPGYVLIPTAKFEAIRDAALAPTPPEPVASARADGEGLEVSLAAVVARKVCESEGREWMGLDNSRADVERWLKAGEIAAEAAAARLEALNAEVERWISAYKIAHDQATQNGQSATQAEARADRLVETLQYIATLNCGARKPETEEENNLGQCVAELQRAAAEALREPKSGGGE